MYSLLTSGCTSLIFQPDKNLYALPYQQQMKYVDITIKDDDQPSLHGWYLPTDQEKKGTILFLHGNAQNISTHTQFVYWLPQHGYDVYTVDYRGYGLSEGTAELSGIIMDVQRAIIHIAHRSNDELIVIGHSLGGSLSISAIAGLEKPPVKALIVASSFSDYQLVVRDVLARNAFTNLLKWPLSWTINNHYAPIKWITQLESIPTYIIYSNNDQVIPAKHSKSLHNAATSATYIQTIDGGHNDFLALETNRTILLSIINRLSTQPALEQKN